MDAEETPATVTRRLRFYGGGDYATYWQMDRAAEVAGGFDPSSPPSDILGILELHNARLFIEAGFVPEHLSKMAVDHLTVACVAMRGAVARWFAGLNDDNLDRIGSVDWQYHEHLLDLLAGLSVFERCSAERMLTALDAAGVHLGDMLTSRRLVAAYDEALRDRLLEEPRRAELVIRHHLEGDQKKPTFLPASFTATDSRGLIAAYITSDDPNPNYLRLISTAPIDSKTGVDARLIVAASRRYDSVVADLFKETTLFKTGCTVSVSETQSEPVKVGLNELVMEFTFSKVWLEETEDFPSVLNNFQFLFEFAPDQGLLSLPAFSGELRGLMDMMGMNGATDYRTGTAFNAKDMATLVQTAMYLRYLASKEIDLEQVLQWYFEVQLAEVYGITDFVFTPSSPTANYLERCRNLFAEMESIATQFALLVEDGAIDHDVASASAELVRYRTIPSALAGKYVYATDHPEIRAVLHILFSDQSGLTYVHEALRGDTGFDLLRQNTVVYDTLHPWQQPLVDKLIGIGVVAKSEGRLHLKNADLVRVLKSLHDSEAASYHHLKPGSQRHVDRMVQDGWLDRRSTLLTDAEAAYFNYNLNSVEFSNGPKLRNKYQHGIQPKAAGEIGYEETYLRAMRLMVALTIKINDELWLVDKAKTAPA